MSKETCLEALKTFFKESGFEGERIEEIVVKIDRYVEMIVEWNKTHNLTGLKRYQDICFKLVLDSLLFLRVSGRLGVAEGDSFADLGSGAGFPGVPLSICLPENRFLLIESRKKKSSFLKFVAAELELRNVEVYSQRAEALALEISRGELVPFRFIVSKAFAEPVRVLEIAGGLVAENGLVVVWTKPEKISEVEKEVRMRNVSGWDWKWEMAEFSSSRNIKAVTGFSIFKKREAKTA